MVEFPKVRFLVKILGNYIIHGSNKENKANSNNYHKFFKRHADNTNCPQQNRKGYHNLSSKDINNESIKERQNNSQNNSRNSLDEKMMSDQNLNENKAKNRISTIPSKTF